MITVKITNHYGNLEVKEGEKGFSRQLEWRAAGAECYLVGPFKPLEYDQARNLFLQVCIAAHIPAISVRRAKHAPPKRQINTDTKRMF